MAGLCNVAAIASTVVLDACFSRRRRSIGKFAAERHEPSDDGMPARTRAFHASLPPPRRSRRVAAIVSTSLAAMAVANAAKARQEGPAEHVRALAWMQPRRGATLVRSLTACTSCCLASAPCEAPSGRIRDVLGVDPTRCEGARRVGRDDVGVFGRPRDADHQLR